MQLHKPIGTCLLPCAENLTLASKGKRGLSFRRKGKRISTEYLYFNLSAMHSVADGIFQ